MREVHSPKSPFALARSVPGDSVKTVFDAWNGYHSVPIREEDRHLTMFTTHGVCSDTNAPHKVICQVVTVTIEDLTISQPTCSAMKESLTTACCMTRSPTWKSIGGG